MDRATAEQLLTEVRANLARLQGCPFHAFSVDATPNKPYLKRWRCINCGGEVDVSAKVWYERGLAHGRKE